MSSAEVNVIVFKKLTFTLKYQVYTCQITLHDGNAHILTVGVKIILIWCNCSMIVPRWFWRAILPPKFIPPKTTVNQRNGNENNPIQNKYQNSDYYISRSDTHACLITSCFPNNSLAGTDLLTQCSISILAWRICSVSSSSSMLMIKLNQGSRPIA